MAEDPACLSPPLSKYNETGKSQNTRPTSSQKSVSFHRTTGVWIAPCLGLSCKVKTRGNFAEQIWGTRGIPSSYLYLPPKVRCPPLDHTSNCATRPPLSPAHPLLPHIGFPDALSQFCALSQLFSNFWCFPMAISNTTSDHTTK